MRRLAIIVSILSLSILPTLARADHDASSSKSTSAKSTTLSGCLSGPTSEGIYKLKTATKEVEVGGLADLKDHVGHQVKLTGTWAKSGSDIGEKEKSSSTADKSEAGEKHFKVTSIQHVADTCSGKTSESGTTTKKSGY